MSDKQFHQKYYHTKTFHAQTPYCFANSRLACLLEKAYYKREDKLLSVSWVTKPLSPIETNFHTPTRNPNERRKGFVLLLIKT